MEKAGATDFEFSVRCNRDVTHKYRFQPIEEAFEIFDEMISICEALKAEVLHMQTPSSFQPDGKTPIC